MNFDFCFKFPIPKPNSERIILERDSLGKIVKSKPSGDMSCLSVASA